MRTIATSAIWQGMNGKGPVKYCKADEGKWEKVCRRVGQTGDGERKESPGASGGQLDDGTSRELQESTWPGRSELGLETRTESRFI